MDKKFDAVLFDFDGTFADTGRGIAKCADYAAEYFGLPPLTEKEHRYFVGPPLYDSFKKMFSLEKDEDIYTAIAKYRECYTAGAMFELDVYEGIEDLIKDLHESGIKVVIASSKPANYVDMILERLGLRKYIDLISCPVNDNVKKNKFQLISSAVETLGISKDRAVMVGDRYLDIDGAKQAGVKSIGAAYGYGGKEELVKAGADYIAESVSDVRKAVF